ncbi:Uu.00g064120.m01.CDS01 [Anthostomella pinea]|uniref:Uu.00g064120.m01.CDS01 n=1 Tax=Anthostomella pinea TaxID=933095 RepID=A0AAI8YKN0_9PEZI|nr:Uu.00g064120.m01.CDS01 [Anthostomella pinea]
MEGHHMDVDAWRHVRLGDEPIYCAAPSPPNPRDLICAGSDDELDDAAKLAKRTRYEEQGLRYLRGMPLRIMSASLRGPFDQTSGWQNPWLPKLSSIAVPPIAARPQSKHLPAIEPALYKEIASVPEVEDGTTPGHDNSMLCHLPSPQSHRELELDSNILDAEKRVQIEAWADSLPAGTLGRDEFWVPDQDLVEQEGGLSRKRPAGDDWLKKKASKRSRPNNSQSTGAASTPTPLPAMQPSSGSVSAVGKSTHNKEKASILAKKAASRSFEMTTPSSSADHGRKEPVRRVLEASARGDTTVSDDDNNEIDVPQVNENAVSGAPSSTTSATADPSLHTVFEETPGWSTVDDSTVPKKQGYARNADEQTVVENVLEQQPMDRQAEQYQEEEGDTNFESCADQSFQYRARLPKQSTPPPAAENSSPSQTGIPEATPHTNAVHVPSAPDSEERTLIERVEDASETHISVNGMLSGKSENSKSIGNADIAQSGLANMKSSDDQMESIKPTNPVQADEATASALSVNTIETASGNTSPPNVSEAEHHVPVPQTVHEVKMGRSTFSAGSDPVPQTIQEVKMGHGPNSSVPQTVHEVKVGHGQTFSAGSDLVFDEGSTLIGDPMDVDQPGGDGTHNPPMVLYAIKSPNGAKSHARIAADALDMIENMNPTEASKGEANCMVDPAVVPRSQSKSSDAQPVNMSSLVSAGTSEAKKSIPVIGVKEVFEGDGEGEQIQPSPSEPMQAVGRKSPWGSFVLADTYLEIDDVKPDPKEEDRGSSLRSPTHINVLSSPVGSPGSPNIRPSQQSPWAEGTVAPVTVAIQQQGTVVVAETATATLEFASPGSDAQSPWNESNEHSLFSRDSLLPSLPGYKITPQRLQLQRVPTALGPQQRALGMMDISPSTPMEHGSRQSTPDPEISIKSFAKFNTPSSPRRQQRPTYRFSSTGQRRGILTGATPSNPWSNTRSNRRVSFAPLPDEEDDAVALPPSRVTRAASPPPPTSVRTIDEDVDGKFRNHFNAVDRRAIGEDMPRFRLQPRLLPSSSQQRAVSPAIDAMAEAFRAADARQDIRSESKAEVAAPLVDVAAPMAEVTSDAPQSPWQDHSEVVDDVADVMGNLDSFLDAWDVDVEMDKAREEAKEDEDRRRRSANEMDTLHGMGILG